MSNFVKDLEDFGVYAAYWIMGLVLLCAAFFILLLMLALFGYGIK